MHRIQTKQDFTICGTKFELCFTGKFVVTAAGTDNF